MGPLTKLIPLLPRMLLARCVGVFVEDLFMSFRFQFKAKQDLIHCGDVFFDILIKNKGALALGML